MVFCASAWALGVGELTVNSALNEPLDAEIDLIYSDQSELGQLRVQMASAEDFARVGLDRSFLTVPIEFSVEPNASGRQVIRLSSEEAVVDPFLSLLIDVNWATGRMLREYTILLDPPVFAPAAGAITASPASSVPPAAEPTPIEPEPVAEPAPVRSEPAVAQQPARSQPATEPEAAAATPVIDEPAPVRPSERDSLGVTSYGPVSRGETLWGIVRDMKPAEVSMNQMMVAVLRSNPDAFFQDNINSLKRGAVLRLPDASEVSRLTSSEAFELVKTHNTLWEQYRGNRTSTRRTSSTAALDSVYSDSTSSSDDSASDRLELVTPSQNGRTSAAARPGDQDNEQMQQRLASLQDELARATEDRINAEAENGELRSRVEELEALVESYERTMSLRDDELADLQAQLAMAQQNGAAGDATEATDYDPFAIDTDTTSEAVIEEPSGSDPFADDDFASSADDGFSSSDELASSDTSTDASTSDDFSSVAETASGDDVDTPAAPVSQPPRPPQESLMDKLLSLPVIGGLVALLLLIGGVFWWRSRQGSDPAAAGSSLVTRMMESRRAQSDDDDVDIDDALGLDEPEDDIDTEGDTIATGGLEEDDLHQAIAENPDDPQLRLSLLRRYYAENNAEAFAVAASELNDVLNDKEHTVWREVHSMGAQLCSDHPLFGGTDEADDDLDLGFEFDEAPTGEQVAVGLGSAPEADDSDELELDFDLDDVGDDLVPDEPVDAGQARSETEPDEAKPEEDLGLDFDLDLGLDDDETEAAVADELDGPELDLDLGDLDEHDSDVTQERPVVGVDQEADTIEREAIDIPGDELDFELELGDEADDTEQDSDKEVETVDTGSDDPDDFLAQIEAESILPEGEDVVETKLDLARAYIDMGDPDGARSMLDEVVAEGNETQRSEAERLKSELE